MFNIARRHFLRNILWWIVVFIFFTLGVCTGRASGLDAKPLKMLDQKPEQYLIAKPATTTTSTTTTTRPQAVVKYVEKPKYDPVIVESHELMLASAGIKESDWPYVEYIFSRESGWNASSVSANGCIGLGQNCLSNGQYFIKLACPNWQTDVICQIKRWDEYASKYGGWYGSYLHWNYYKSW